MTRLISSSIYNYGKGSQVLLTVIMSRVVQCLPLQTFPAVLVCIEREEVAEACYVARYLVFRLASSLFSLSTALFMSSHSHLVLAAHLIFLLKYRSARLENEMNYMFTILPY